MIWRRLSPSAALSQLAMSLDARQLVGVEQVAVGGERRAHRFDQALGFDLRFLERARAARRP
jgi:hypothetical protein